MEIKAPLKPSTVTYSLERLTDYNFKIGFLVKRLIRTNLLIHCETRSRM